MSSDDQRLYVKITIARCCGYTPCADICPEVYKLDEDGFAFVDDDRIPLGLEAKAKAGAAACPERAIYVGETPPES